MTENMTILLELVEHMESDLKKVKAIATKLQSPRWSAKQSSFEPILLDKGGGPRAVEDLNDDPNVKVVEGIFDGYFMIGSDAKKYPVPMNYSSKSKLIQWDQLKLRIMSDGSLRYKVTRPAERKFIKAVIVKHEDGRFQAMDDAKKLYNLNQAAVTFFAGEAGNEASIIVPLDDKADYAAIEAIVK